MWGDEPTVSAVDVVRKACVLTEVEAEWLLGELLAVGSEHGVVILPDRTVRALARVPDGVVMRYRLAPPTIPTADDGRCCDRYPYCFCAPSEAMKRAAVPEPQEGPQTSDTE